LTLVDVAALVSGGIDVYAVAPTSGFGGAQPLATLQYPANNATPVMIAAGNYERIVTAAGDTPTVLFDSDSSSVALAACRTFCG